ncbi:hypothetical protein SAMN06265364_10545 [Prevotella jejuni]|uniref:Uncharacterized protein n=1 Tax=Prevotella jejuni TaxID=1177574 RepID=A0AA94ISG4_9BACT|nr:hypothetical protein SAMN06265364_10545 [Prevotella jejuni]
MRIENNTYHPTKGSLADSWLSFLTRWGVLSLTERTYAELVGYIFLSQN